MLSYDIWRSSYRIILSTPRQPMIHRIVPMAALVASSACLAEGSEDQHGVGLDSEAVTVIPYDNFRGTLTDDDRMNANDMFTPAGDPPPNRSRLIMQADCNLVFYEGNDDHVRFSSGTRRNDSHCHADMENDGNFVVYDGNDNPIWSFSGELERLNVPVKLWPGSYLSWGDNDERIYLTRLDGLLLWEFED
jgi:hypothetical protein